MLTIPGSHLSVFFLLLFYILATFKKTKQLFWLFEPPNWWHHGLTPLSPPAPAQDNCPGLGRCHNLLAGPQAFELKTFEAQQLKTRASQLKFLFFCGMGPTVSAGDVEQAVFMSSCLHVCWCGPCEPERRTISGLLGSWGVEPRGASTCLLSPSSELLPWLETVRGIVSPNYPGTRGPLFVLPLPCLSNSLLLPNCSLLSTLRVC